MKVTKKKKETRKGGQEPEREAALPESNSPSSSAMADNVPVAKILTLQLCTTHFATVTCHKQSATVLV